MQRVSVVGTSGSGKSWLAQRLACALGVPWLELDGVRHQPGWEPLPDAEFIERISSIVRWAWTTHAANRERYEAAMADPRWRSLTFVRLRSMADVR